MKWSQTAVDKYCTLRGKQPRLTDNASKSILSAKGSGIPRTTWQWAWKQPSVKKRVTTYKMRDSAPKIQETKYDAEAVIYFNRVIEKERSRGSRTFCKARRRKSTRFRKRKAIRIENVDMSNEKNDEKEFGRKPKGSDIKSISSRVRTVPNGKLKGGSRWGREICMLRRWTWK